MATIIKLPTNSSKGILSITNLEMTYSKNILEKIKRSKVDGLFYIIQIITITIFIIMVFLTPSLLGMKHQSQR